MNSTYEQDQELRTKAIQFINYVCNTHPFAFTEQDALDALLKLINGEIAKRDREETRAILDRLALKIELVIEHGADFNDMNQYLAVPLKEIEAELAALKEVKK